MVSAKQLLLAIVVVFHPAMPDSVTVSHDSDALSSLNLAENSLGIKGSDIVKSILKTGVLPKLRMLDMSKNSNLASKAAGMNLSSALQANTTLTQIDLSGITSEKFPDLTNGSKFAEELSGGLSANKSLLKLYLSETKIFAAGCKALASALLRNRVLQELRISSCSLTLNPQKLQWPDMSGVKELANSTQTMVSLEILLLKDNALANSSGGDAVHKILVQPSIRQERQTCLKLLDVSCNFTQQGAGTQHAGKAFAEKIWKGLEANKSLTHFDISNNSIGADGLVLLAQALRGNQTITILDMSGNKCKEKKSLEFAKMLVTMHSLSELNIASNGLKSEGAKHIVEAFKEVARPTIVELDLSDNAIDHDEECLKLIADLLIEQPQVTRVSLLKNGIKSGLTAALMNINAKMKDYPCHCYCEKLATM